MSEKRFEHNREYFPLNVDEIIDNETGESYDCEDATDVLNELFDENEQLKEENKRLKLVISKLDEDNTYYIVENRRLKEKYDYDIEDYRQSNAELRKENERLKEENTALDNENAEHLADNIRELDLLEKLTKFLHECGLTNEQRALFHNMITEEDLQPKLEHQTWKWKNE